MIKYIITVVCIGILSIPLNAQDTLDINFEEAVAQAIKGNADHNINVNNQRLNKAIRQQALWSIILPIITILPDLMLMFRFLTCSEGLIPIRQKN